MRLKDQVALITGSTSGLGKLLRNVLLMKEQKLS